MDLLSEFETWATGRAGLEPDVARTLLELKRDYLGERDPAHWTETALVALLLDVIPRKVSAPQDWYDAVVPTTKAYLLFLSDRKALRGDSLADLLVTIDEIADEAAEALADPRRGMGKALLSMMEGLDPSDPAQLDRAMEAFNALPQAERDRILAPSLARMGFAFENDDDDGDDDELREYPDEDLILDGVTLPARRLVPAETLAAQAMLSPVLGRLRSLALWVEQVGDIPHEGPGEARRAEALELLGVATEGLSEAELQAELAHWWELAVWSDFVWTLSGTVASLGLSVTNLDQADPDDVVATWEGVFDVVVGAVSVASDDAAGKLRGAVDILLVEMLLRLYVSGAVDHLAPGPEPLEGLSADLDADSAAALPGLVDQRLDQLAELGALVREGDRTTLTDLGVWGIAQFVQELGAEAPLTDPALLTAEELVADPTLLNPGGDLAAEWVRLQGGESSAAVAVLRATAAAATAGARLTGVPIALRLGGPQALAEVPHYFEHPLLGPHLRLLTRDEDGPVDPDDQVFLGLDTLSVVLELVDPPVRSDDLPDDIWQLAASIVETPDLWELLHPSLIPVMDAIGSGHPVGRVRKQAKKVAHKARMAPPT